MSSRGVTTPPSVPSYAPLEIRRVPGAPRAKREARTAVPDAVPAVIPDAPSATVATREPAKRAADSSDAASQAVKRTTMARPAPRRSSAIPDPYKAMVAQRNWHARDLHSKIMELQAHPDYAEKYSMATPLEHALFMRLLDAYSLDLESSLGIAINAAPVSK